MFELKWKVEAGVTIYIEPPLTPTVRHLLNLSDGLNWTDIAEAAEKMLADGWDVYSDIYHGRFGNEDPVVWLYASRMDDEARSKHAEQVSEFREAVAKRMKWDADEWSRKAAEATKARRAFARLTESDPAAAKRFLEAHNGD